MVIVIIGCMTNFIFWSPSIVKNRFCFHVLSGHVIELSFPLCIARHWWRGTEEERFSRLLPNHRFGESRKEILAPNPAINGGQWKGQSFTQWHALSGHFMGSNIIKALPAFHRNAEWESLRAICHTPVVFYLSKKKWKSHMAKEQASVFNRIYKCPLVWRIPDKGRTSWRFNGTYTSAIALCFIKAPCCLPLCTLFEGLHS